MWTRLSHLFAATVALVATSVAYGSEEEDLAKVYGGEDFISIATGQRQPLSRAPAVATVITAQDIQAMGATNLDEVLETVPGLHVSLSSLRFSSIYSIRGIRTDANPEVLMLVNGVPITQLYLGGRGTQNTVPVESIERVEVVLGPYSAVYGADAFSGVVNVLTKTANDIRGTKLGGRAGSFDSWWGWIEHGGKWAGFDVALSLEWSTTDGDPNRIIQQDAQTLFDRIFGTNASLAPGPANTGGQRLDTRLTLSRGNWDFHFWNWRQYDFGVGPGLALALDPTGRGDADNYLLDLGYRNTQWLRNWDVSSRLSYLDVNTTSQQRLFAAGTVLPIGSDGNINPGNPAGLVLFPDGFIGNPSVFERDWRLDLSGFYSGFARQKIRLGTGFSYGDLFAHEQKNYGPGVIDGTQDVVGGNLADVTGTPFVFIEPHSRTAYYASLQDQWSFARDWELTAGVRFDHYSDFGNTVNPRLALVWQTGYDLSTKLLYGRGFRAPSFAELFVINNPVGLGNPNLSPETINSLELALDYEPAGNLRSQFAIFGYRIDNLIALVPDAGGASSTYQNTGSQTGYGFEAEIRWDARRDLAFTANYAFQIATDDATGRDAGNYPRNQIYARADWRFLPDWHLDTQVNWVADRQRPPGDTRSALPNYTTVDLTARRKRIHDRWDIAVSARNLFNDHGFEPSPTDLSVPGGSLVPGDFPIQGRSIYGEVRYHF
jgi:outer membrane receptor protein involved in Fe transport